jgi:hypothetical protein
MKLHQFRLLALAFAFLSWAAVLQAQTKPPTGATRALILEAMALGQDAIVRGRLEEARKHLREVLRLDPSNAGAAFQLGEVARLAGDTEGARAEYRRAVALDPDGEWGKRAIQAIVQLSRRASAADIARDAHAAALRGDVAGAQRLLAEARKAGPDAPTAKQLDELETRLGGSPDSAQRNLDKFRALPSEVREFIGEFLTIPDGVWSPVRDPQILDPARRPYSFEHGEGRDRTRAEGFVENVLLGAGAWITVTDLQRFSGPGCETTPAVCRPQTYAAVYVLNGLLAPLVHTLRSQDRLPPSTIYRLTTLRGRLLPMALGNRLLAEWTTVIEGYDDPEPYKISHSCVVKSMDRGRTSTGDDYEGIVDCESTFSSARFLIRHAWVPAKGRFVQIENRRL